MLESGQFLRALFDAAVAAADPMTCVPAHLPGPPGGRTVVLGAGKASARMAQAFEQHWQGAFEGLVLTRYGHAAPCRRIEIVEAAHPVPDAAGAEATARMLDMVAGLGPDDLVVCLMSGGGSALLTAPAGDLTLEDKQEVNRELLRSGATIQEMNTVRKHLSRVKGGRLAVAAHPARVHAILISDVPGDDPDVIASGPTVPDPTTFEDARRIVERYGMRLPPRAVAHLEAAAEETPKPGDPRLARAGHVFAATPMASLKAAATLAGEHGVASLILGDAIEGESREAARVIAGIAKSVATHGLPIAPPAVLLSGGETTVTVRGEGSGGPNAEFALALSLALRGEKDVWAIACDTDGIDGQGEIAGALIGPDTLQRAREEGLDPFRALDGNDAHGFFCALGDSVVTGPTHTNVNDFRAILISTRNS